MADIDHFERAENLLTEAEATADLELARLLVARADVHARLAELQTKRTGTAADWANETVDEAVDEAGDELYERGSKVNKVTASALQPAVPSGPGAPATVPGVGRPVVPSDKPSGTADPGPRPRAVPSEHRPPRAIPGAGRRSTPSGSRSNRAVSGAASRAVPFPLRPGEAIPGAVTKRNVQGEAVPTPSRSGRVAGSRRAPGPG